MGSSPTARIRRLEAYAFIAPAAFFVIVFLIGSVLYTLVISFTQWNLVGTPTLIGGQNYVKLANDPSIRMSLVNTVIWVVGSLVIPVLGGLLIAVFMDALPLQGLWKAAIYLPVVLAPTVSGLIFKEILSLDGPLNHLLGAIGLASAERAWLQVPTVNTFVMVVTSTWRTLGPAMVLFLVGLQTIPGETVEAAMLDGANAWQSFRRIKLPQITPILVVVVTMSVVNSFTTFDYVYVMTRGGPYQSSETLAYTIYRLAFSEWRVGYGSALAIVLSVITLAFSGVYIFRGMQRDPKGSR